jgi:O-acetyl-ADP-ribose deacetylase (regulator of RNase III)/uncharacterized protein YwgA
MVRVLLGDLFESEAQTWVNTVNCVGIMGKGVALEFKKRFPEMFEDYESRCRIGEVRLGRPYLFKRLIEPWIVNFPTKHHWRQVTNIHDVVKGLEFLLAHYKEWDVKSLAVPPLGCGNGQLEWRVVGPTLYRHLQRLDIPVELYAPHGTHHAELQPSFLGRMGEVGDLVPEAPEPQFIRPGWVAIVDTIRRLQAQPYHPPVGRTTSQKIAYVLTDLGVDTGLHFRRSSYGPYSEEFKPAIGRLMNNGLLEERRLGRMIEVRTGATFEDSRRAYALQLKEFEPAIRRTTDLFMRVSTKEAELVATIRFAHADIVCGGLAKPSERDVLREVMEWKKRRRPPLDEPEVASHIRNLAALGWLDVSPSADLPLPLDELSELRNEL